MLIRSQNKEILINFDITPSMGVFETKNGDIKILWSTADETLALGSYSAKEKAIKVLDMIQENYKSIELYKTFFTGLTGHKIIAESNSSYVNGFEDAKKVFENKIIFQMPEDSEVEE